MAEVSPRPYHRGLCEARNTNHCRLWRPCHWRASADLSGEAEQAQADNQATAVPLGETARNDHVPHVAYQEDHQGRQGPGHDDLRGGVHGRRRYGTTYIHIQFRADDQEYFIKHFMEEGYTKARLDRRKLVTYKDIGESAIINCLARDAADASYRGLSV